MSEVQKQVAKAIRTAIEQGKLEEVARLIDEDPERIAFSNVWGVGCTKLLRLVNERLSNG